MISVHAIDHKGSRESTGLLLVFQPFSSQMLYNGCATAIVAQHGIKICVKRAGLQRTAHRVNELMQRRLLWYQRAEM